MKKLFLMLFVGCSIMATAQCCCTPCNKQCSNTTEQLIPSDAAQVEILYFHGKQRCATCVAIENETKTLMAGELADLVKSGKVKLRVIDFSTDEGKAIATKYKVTFSSLFVVANPGKNEKAEDLTRFAFANARSNPEAFRKEVKNKVMNAIK